MPQCVKCKEFFPPNYVEILEGDNISQDEKGNWPMHCIFCKLNIDIVEREETPNSGKYIEYTKQQCLIDYKKFLRKLKESKNVKDIMEKNPFVI